MKKREGPDYEAFVALRYKMRAERSRPIFDKLHAWLEAEAPKILPKCPIGEAIQYARQRLLPWSLPNLMPKTVFFFVLFHL